MYLLFYTCTQIIWMDNIEHSFSKVIKVISTGAPDLIFKENTYFFRIKQIFIFQR